MMGNLYKNKNSKFSLWAKRLVWAETAEQAINEAATDKKDDANVDVAVLADVAKTKIVVPEDEGEAKTKAEAARAQVEKLTSRLEQEVANIKARAALKVRLEAVNPAGDDFLHAVDEMKVIDQKNNELPEALRVDLTGKQTAVENAGNAFYEGKMNVTWFAEDGVKAEYTVDSGNFRLLLADISQMQQVLADGKFIGLAPEKVEEIKTAYQKRVEVGLQWLQTHKEDNYDSAGVSLQVAQLDEKAALDRFAFALTNLAAAEKGGQEGHEAGAKQYMSMVLAEQEARRAWIASDYGPNEIVVPSDDENSVVLPIQYNAAVRVFNEALLLSGRTNDPKYNEAAKKFKESAELFRIVKTTEYAMKEYKEFGKKREEAKKLITSIGTPWVLGLGEYATIKERINGKGDLSSDQLDKDLTRLQELKTAWENFKITFQGKLDGSQTHISGDLADGNYAVDISKVVNDYLAPENMGLDDLQKQMFREASDYHLCNYTFTYKSPDGGIQERKAVAKFSDGKWEAQYINESNGGSGNSGAEGAPPVS